MESHDSVPNIEEIVEASDAVMVARGDLGMMFDTPGQWLSISLTGTCTLDVGG